MRGSAMNLRVPAGVDTSTVMIGSEVRSSTKSNEISSVLHIRD
jgi:hypothetical protein